MKCVFIFPLMFTLPDGETQSYSNQNTSWAIGS